ncbi:MAG: hypothetical protein HZC22_08935 [Rhodocyclales bacterium]|nr:hypothetical protein [Rhodocyclales bacterium]
MKTTLLSLSLAALLLAGCSKTVTWKEEVQLSDGRVIVVERETFNVSGGDEMAHGSGYRPSEARIRINTEGIVTEWHSTKKDRSQWPENPLVLDIVNGEVIVMSAVPTSPTCDTYSKYVFHNGLWREETLPEEFPRRDTNLYLRDAMGMPSFVDLPTKSKENQSSRYPRRLRQVGPHRTFCHG